MMTVKAFFIVPFLNPQGAINPIIFLFPNSTGILKIVEQARLPQLRDRPTQVLLQPFGHQASVTEFAGSFVG
jgi:hypothetical protein